MPAPAVTAVMVVISSVAAVLALKEFVYEPHLAHRFEAWLEQHLHERRVRREARRAAPVPSEAGAEAQDSSEDNKTTPSKSRLSEQEKRRAEQEEDMIPLNVNVWRSEVDRNSELRQRTQSSTSRNASEQTRTSAPFPPIEPSLIVFDASMPSTPASSALNTLSSSHHSAAAGTGTGAGVGDPLRSPFLSLSEMGSDTEADMVSALSNLSAEEHGDGSVSEASWTSVHGA